MSCEYTSASDSVYMRVCVCVCVLLGLSISNIKMPIDQRNEGADVSLIAVAPRPTYKGSGYVYGWCGLVGSRQ